MTVKPTPEELMAYADGQLEPEHMKRIERVIAADPDLRSIVEDHQRTRAAARHAIDDMASSPMSPGLARLSVVLSAPGKVVPLRRRLPEMLAWPAAAAACLVAGLVSGSLATTSNDDLIRWQGGPSAGRQLASVLDRSPTGKAAGRGDRQAVVVASFKAGDGRFCRQFEIGEGAADGVACRAENAWKIVALAQRPGGPGAIQAAGGETPVAVAVAGLGPGPRIEGEAELDLVKRNWRD